MASLLLGCGAVFSERLARRHRAHREITREYAENFELLKKENEKRVQTIANQYSASSSPPPSYEDIHDAASAGAIPSDRRPAESNVQRT
ncbi:uncharacterized protein K452DRAFT_286201 [Aplosporella prunicola CBS 121167]|uniref:Uncharacterized protein n=1 Tax=Aplosporella prunicola CBS 121167 TaxID=1176127 RepID=A0A6A6BKK7_9PEZI|nr:uncharacterized protein K452DRAFT_286201 [Aplosporella prunicola CBS 121167]KAF2143377.1 hypothetical protein K452DRAFT_286201 [Aplosporella prunicola CBS 121167]